MSAETKKIFGGLEFAGYIFLTFCVIMFCSSFAFRPQEDVLARFMEPVPAAEPVAVAAAEPAETRRADAEEMARVVYGTALYNSTEAQRAVMWCIINRVESPLYPDTVVEVCQQPSQWMGYSADTPVLGQLYDLAVEVLEAWENGGARNLPEGCLWFDWNGNEAITFRTAFDSSGNDWRVE